MDIRIKEHITQVATSRKDRGSIFCTMNMADAITTFSDESNGDFEVVEFLKHLKDCGAELLELRTSPDKKELIATIKFFSKEELDKFYETHA